VFTLAIPVMIAIVYYLHDIPKHKRIQAKIDFCAHCVIGMIQNITQNRSDKKIRRKDLSYIRCSGTLITYPGMSGYSCGTIGSNKKFPTGLMHLYYVFYVKGTGHNRCKICWCWDSHFIGTTPDNSLRDSYGAGNERLCVVKYVSGEANSYDIYPSLTIEEGEEKVIVDLCYCVTNYLCNGEKMEMTSIGRYFGLYIASPKRTWAKGGIMEGYFHKIVIFTPNPGLFSETAPKES
jgi:hypothetical protein